MSNACTFYITSSSRDPLIPTNSIPECPILVPETPIFTLEHFAVAYIYTYHNVQYKVAPHPGYTVHLNRPKWLPWLSICHDFWAEVISKNFQFENSNTVLSLHLDDVQAILICLVQWRMDQSEPEWTGNVHNWGEINWAFTLDVNTDQTELHVCLFFSLSFVQGIYFYSIWKVQHSQLQTSENNLKPP